MAYRDSTATTVNGTSINATKPALVKSGDILLCYLVTDTGLNGPAPTVTAPAGWTLIPGSNQGANTGAPDGFTSFVYWKLAGNSETATYTFSITGSATPMIALVGCWSGRNPNPSFITHGTVNTTGNATPVTVSDTGVTALSNDDIIVFATGDITVGTDTWGFTPPANYAERQDSQITFNVATLATRDEVFSGATGTLSLTLTRSAGTGTSGWGIFVISIPAVSNEPSEKPFPIVPGKLRLSKLVLQKPASFNEDINIDKWNIINENPPRKSSLPTAILAGSLFFTPVVSQTETITVDKWYQPISQPYDKIKYRVSGGEYRFEVPRQIVISDWWQPTSLPILRKPTQLLGGESRFELPRTILISDWFSEIRQPHFSKIRQQPSGESRTDVVTPTEIVTLDKWYRPPSEPYFTKRRDVNTGESRYELPRTILLTDWFQPASIPVVRKPTQLLGGEARFEVPRTILLSDWFTEILQPYFSKFRLIPFGEYRFETPRAILLTDWYQPISQPLKQPNRQTYFGEYHFELPRTILLSDWNQAASQPGSKLKQLIFAPETRTEVATESVTLDKWFQPVQQPYFNRKTNSNFGEFRFEVPRSILLSDWFNDTSQPVKERIRQLLGGESRVEIIIAPEVITLDKWYQDTQQPYFKRLVQISTTEYEVYFEYPNPPVVVNIPTGTPEDESGSGGDAAGYNQVVQQQDDDLITILMQILLWQ